MQNKDRPKRGRKCEMKMAAAYDGWVKDGKGRYSLSNKEGLIPYKERCLKLPEPPEGLEYRNLGTMEHHVCDGVAKRMKHQKASWSKEGASNLGRILCLKVYKNLYEAVTSLSKAILPEARCQARTVE